MVYTPKQRAVLREQDKTWGHKLIVRLLIQLFGFTAFGLLGSLFLFYKWSAWPIWVCLVSVFAAVMWSAFQIDYMTFRRKSVHPGWRVALDLLLWLTILGLSGLPVLAVGRRSMPVRPWRRHSTDTDIIERSLRVFRLAIAAGVLMLLVQLLQFIAFIWAIVDTVRHNRHATAVEAADIMHSIANDPKHQHADKVIIVKNPEPTLHHQPANHYNGNTQWDGNNSMSFDRRSIDTIRAPVTDDTDSMADRRSIDSDHTTIRPVDAAVYQSEDQDEFHDVEFGLPSLPAIEVTHVL